MRSPADCLIFFRVQAGRLGRRSGFLGGLGGASLRGYRRALWAFLRDMPRGTTKETKILVHATLTFLRCQLPVFPELGGKVGNELPRFRRASLALGRAREVPLPRMRRTFGFGIRLRRVRFL